MLAAAGLAAAGLKKPDMRYIKHGHKGSIVTSAMLVVTGALLVVTSAHKGLWIA